MNKFQIFLASSINEFKEQRNEIGDFIRKIQDVLIDYDIIIKLFECEFHDNSIGIGRKQEEYNQEIEKSQIFLMLVGKKVGQYTLEEYNVAIQSNVPYIHVLFEKVKHDSSVQNFKENLTTNVTSEEFQNTIQLKKLTANSLKNILKNSISIEKDGVCVYNQFIKF